MRAGDLDDEREQQTYGDLDPTADHRQRQQLFVRRRGDGDL